MIRLRIALWSLLAVFAVSGLSAAAASAEGPFWHVGGAKLKQGSKGIKLQSKGPLTLVSSISSVTVTVTCGVSTSNGTIDGQGEVKQGQGKGKVVYEQCKAETTDGPCEVGQPIETTQLKSHLVTTTFQGKEQIANLLEPSPSQQIAKPRFAEIHLTNCKPSTFNGVYPVKGSVVGVVEPQEVEGQEGSLYFPPEAIKKVTHEGQEVKVGLVLGEGTTEATFSGYYGARLQSGEVFGVFRS